MYVLVYVLKITVKYEYILVCIVCKVCKVCTVSDEPELFYVCVCV